MTNKRKIELAERHVKDILGSFNVLYTSYGDFCDVSIRFPLLYGRIMKPSELREFVKLFELYQETKISEIKWRSVCSIADLDTKIGIIDSIFRTTCSYWGFVSGLVNSDKCLLEGADIEITQQLMCYTVLKRKKYSLYDLADAISYQSFSRTFAIYNVLNWLQFATILPVDETFKASFPYIEDRTTFMNDLSDLLKNKLNITEEMI